MSKSIAQMQPLKTYHGFSHSLFVETVIVGMVLFQQQYQNLHPAKGFGLSVSGVNLRISVHCNAEQFVSPDCHLTHLKRVAVFHKSTISLLLNTLVVWWEPGGFCQSFSGEPWSRDCLC